MYATLPLRRDGREANEIRNFKFSIGNLNQQLNYNLVNNNAIASITVGNTCVIASVNTQVTTNELIMIKWSNFAFSPRQSSTHIEKQAKKYTSLLKDMYEYIPQFQKKSITLNIFILVDDGASLSACINVSTLALIKAGVSIDNIPISCTCCVIDAEIYVDPCLNEQLQAESILTVTTLQHTGEIISIYAEKTTDYKKMKIMLEFAIDVIKNHYLKEFFECQEQIVMKSTQISHYLNE